MFVGKKFNRWTVIGEPVVVRHELASGRRQPRIMVKVRCSCGIIRSVEQRRLVSGQTQSCGCRRRELAIAHNARRQKTNGGYKDPAYQSWKAMRSRCGDPNHDSWRYYGGRGIAVCARWGSFGDFLADMGPRPAGTSLDRINVNGGYELSNCRWATAEQQYENRRHGGRTPYRFVLAKLLVVS